MARSSGPQEAADNVRRSAILGGLILKLRHPERRLAEGFLYPIKSRRAAVEGPRLENDGVRSSQPGFIFSISAIFLARDQPFSRFSHAMGHLDRAPSPHSVILSEGARKASFTPSSPAEPLSKDLGC